MHDFKKTNTTCHVYGFNRIIHDDIGILPAQIVVPGTTTTALLQQLLPNTDYNVGVVALYSDGEGPAISDAGKTCETPSP